MRPLSHARWSQAALHTTAPQVGPLLHVEALGADPPPGMRLACGSCTSVCRSLPCAAWGCGKHRKRHTTPTQDLWPKLHLHAHCAAAGIGFYDVWRLLLAAPGVGVPRATVLDQELVPAARGMSRTGTGTRRFTRGSTVHMAVHAAMNAVSNSRDALAPTVIDHEEPGAALLGTPAGEEEYEGEEGRSLRSTSTSSYDDDDDGLNMYPPAAFAAPQASGYYYGSGHHAPPGHYASRHYTSGYYSSMARSTFAHISINDLPGPQGEPNLPEHLRC